MSQGEESEKMTDALSTLIEGSVRCLSRLITLVESGVPETNAIMGKITPCVRGRAA
jgi:putative protein kinase ArgK-like GTPase of G3E family